MLVQSRTGTTRRRCGRHCRRGSDMLTASQPPRTGRRTPLRTAPPARRHPASTSCSPSSAAPIGAHSRLSSGSIHIALKRPPRTARRVHWPALSASGEHSSRQRAQTSALRCRLPFVSAVTAQWKGPFALALYIPAPHGSPAGDECRDKVLDFVRDNSLKGADSYAVSLLYANGDVPNLHCDLSGDLTGFEQPYVNDDIFNRRFRGQPWTVLWNADYPVNELRTLARSMVRALLPCRRRVSRRCMLPRTRWRRHREAIAACNCAMPLQPCSWGGRARPCARVHRRRGVCARRSATTYSSSCQSRTLWFRTTCTASSRLASTFARFKACARRGRKITSGRP